VTPFRYERAADATAALDLVSAGSARYLGGGTNLVDLMRVTIERPDALVDVSGLAREIEERADGTLLIGAGVRNTALAEHEAVRKRLPLLSRAILAGASAQIRNMATVGGNLMQRTRCPYFYDVTGSACNKRSPGSGCDAREGLNRMNAILGGSQACIAVHPSDMCVALAALDAQVHLAGPDGQRSVAFTDLHKLPGDTPDVETALKPGELIEAIEIAPLPGGMRSTYRKVRDRSSYAFALVSVAAALVIEGGAVRDARIAFGGIGTVPWRARKAEAALIGKGADEASFRHAAEAELADAHPLSGNDFKIELAARTLTATLGELAETAA